MARQPTSQTTSDSQPTHAGAIDHGVLSRITLVLDRIRPSIQADGGDIELVDVSSDGIVRIRFLGACIGCPSSALTLHMGIERNLKAHVPEVQSVQAVN